jgi:hypothetical protein
VGTIYVRLHCQSLAFERRYGEHERSIGAIVPAMREDGMTVVELEVDERTETGELVSKLAWR